jgi:transcriptional regulator with XRE-family HTH domain
MATNTLSEAFAAFAAELTHWRVERGLSKTQLARRMGFDPSYVSHVESLRQRPSEVFASHAERVLHSNDAILSQFRQYDDLRRSSVIVSRPGELAGLATAVAIREIAEDLRVEREVATLSYRSGWYHCHVAHHLVNNGSEPVTRYPVRPCVERWFDHLDSIASVQRSAPLKWEDCKFEATLRLGETGNGHRETIHWNPPRSRAAVDEVLLQFESGGIPLPLYRAQSAIVEYSYRLPGREHEHMFELDVLMPTHELQFCLDFPDHVDPSVWARQTSFAELAALPAKLSRTDGRNRFEWQILSPMTLTHFEFGWHF